jgi:hypothetical protein
MAKGRPRFVHGLDWVVGGLVMDWRWNVWHGMGCPMHGVS